MPEGFVVINYIVADLHVTTVETKCRNLYRSISHEVCTNGDFFNIFGIFKMYFLGLGPTVSGQHQELLPLHDRE